MSTGNLEGFLRAADNCLFSSSSQKSHSWPFPLPSNWIGEITIGVLFPVVTCMFVEVKSKGWVRKSLFIYHTLSLLWQMRNEEFPSLVKRLGKTFMLLPWLFHFKHHVRVKHLLRKVTNSDAGMKTCVFILYVLLTITAKREYDEAGWRGKTLLTTSRWGFLSRICRSELMGDLLFLFDRRLEEWRETCDLSSRESYSRKRWFILVISE